MIIQLESARSENLSTGRRKVEELASTWGHQATETQPPESSPPQAISTGDKVIDPVSVTALALSIPPAALAVTDLADRIRKRRRARELLDEAEQLADHGVKACMLTRSTEVRAIELRGLTPDQLLEFLAGEETTA